MRNARRVEVTLTGFAPNTAGSGLGQYPSITLINLLGRHVPGEMEYGVDYLNIITVRPVTLATDSHTQ